MHLVAAMVVIRVGESSQLFDRVAIVVIRSHGARIRSLLLGFAGLALVLTLFLDNGITTLLMVALVERATQTIQDNTIQTYQKKALFNKVRENCASPWHYCPCSTALRQRPCTATRYENSHIMGCAGKFLIAL